MTGSIELLADDDPRVPDRGSCTIPGLLYTRARLHPDRVFALFEDAPSWTYRRTLEAAEGAAAGLADLGVTASDRVVSWLPNGPDALRVWFGANLLGAVHVPINTAYRGGLLEHVIRNSGAGVLVAHAELAERLAGIDLADVHTIVVIGEYGGPRLPVRVVDGDILSLGSGRVPDPPRPVEPWDPQMIIYTSGTTGPSKGVLLPYVHHYSSAVAAFGARVREGERYLVQLPLFHVGGTLGVYGMLLYGHSVVVTRPFQTDGFWPLVQRTGITSCTLLGVMATFLAKQPSRTEDAHTPLRWAWVVPLVDDASDFAKRFGVDVYAMYNMTEVSCPIISEATPAVAGTCGRVRPGVELRLVDGDDREVEPGETGELVVRTARPWALNSGYHAMPEETAAAWRNGWFHTGDALRRDEEGNFFFMDRMKDAIRRRGENISSFEVEAELLAHPVVREAAAVAVPGEHGEDEILAVISTVPGTRVDQAELTEFLRSRMAYFMIPRYLRVLEQLPLTPTSKIRKHLLREEGVTADTWDRERAGLKVKGERW
ncbi:AMP-binding protein [Allosalinactinospora lopnorensis]|uniref:AMP-binding protein n=1 Tax=Allosalinactinospora lopnorensis TaxID=1352348 RepID=UPI000AD65860|nr:AMP-binding protein [Allosalinactinospora lopnorensis]